jgi:hypothetical protein
MTGLGWNTVGTIKTVDGEPFDLQNPRAEDVDPEVIAHALAFTCRYNGHTPTFYSVAEHSVRVAGDLAANEWPTEVVLQGLLHDAAEAYVGDLVRPLKLVLGDTWSQLEAAVWRAIADYHDLPHELHPEVHATDRVIYEWEERHIRTAQRCGWTPDYARAAWSSQYTKLTLQRELDR